MQTNNKLSPLQKKYHSLKKKYPQAIIWFKIMGFIESFDDCAITTANTLGTILTKRPDNNILLTGFDEQYLDLNLKKMIKAGHKVVLYQTSYNSIEKKSKS